jgi:hypothetical protein
LKLTPLGCYIMGGFSQLLSLLASKLRFYGKTADHHTVKHIE